MHGHPRERRMARKRFFAGVLSSETQATARDSRNMVPERAIVWKISIDRVICHGALLFWFCYVQFQVGDINTTLTYMFATPVL